MTRARLKTGARLELDGDLLSLVEALYREVALRAELKGSFEDVMAEIRGVVEQMSGDDRRNYLVESLFLNYVTYENEMLDAYMRKLQGGARPARKKSAARVPARRS
jgi:hypothetical protein